MSDLAAYTTNTGQEFTGTFVEEGKVGPIGPRGGPGEKGDKGEKPIRGIDYFTQDDINQMVYRITDDANSVFNENVAEKTADFNTNASNKTTDFNTNATNKTNAYNGNASDKIDTYNTNASTKTSAFNDNYDTKLGAFNTNATNKTNDFNTNASSKTTTFDNNATSKTGTFNENATSKTGDFNDNATSKTNTFNQNATDKTTAFNENYTEKVNAFNEETSEYVQRLGNVEDVLGIDTDTFSTSNTYEVGDIVIYENKVYRCITAIITAGAWDSTKWEELSVRQELDEKETRIQELEESNKLIISNYDTDTAIGSDLNIEDSLNGYNQGIAVVGNTTQIQTEGKNKLNVNKTYSVTGYEEVPISLPAGDYTISNKSITYGVASSYPLLAFRNGGTGIISRSIQSGTALQITLSDSCDSVRIYSAADYATSSGKTTTFNELMIESGSTATPYEPYTGGQPSPSPDYPQNIVDVTGTQEIETSNKNLFKADNTTLKYLDSRLNIDYIDKNSFTLSYKGTNYYGYSNGRFDLDVQPNTDYVFKANFHSTNSNLNGLFLIISIGATNVYSNNYSSGTSITFNSGDNQIVKISFSISNGQSVDNIATWSKIQLEKGSTATPYVPHKEQNITLHLGDIHLRNIGDYKDKIYKENGKWYLEKKCYGETFDENNTATRETTMLSELGYYYTILTAKTFKYDNDNSPITLLKCNNFTSVKNSAPLFMNGKISMSSSKTKLIFGFEGTTDEFLTYRQNNPIDVAYVLLTEEKTEITDQTLLADLAELEKVQTYKGGTVISVTPTTGNPAQLEVKYLKDDRVEQAEEISNIKSALLSLGANV